MTRVILAFLFLSLSACLEGIEVRRDGKPVAFLTESCEQSDGIWLLTGSSSVTAVLALTIDRPVVLLDLGDEERRFTPYVNQGIWLTAERVQMGFDDRHGVEVEGSIRLGGPCLTTDDATGSVR